MGVILPEDQIADVLKASGKALIRYVTADGTASFDTSVHIITGTKP